MSTPQPSDADWFTAKQCISLSEGPDPLGSCARIIAAHRQAYVDNAVRDARADKARLDWLDAEAKGETGHRPPVMALSVKKGYARNSTNWVNIVPPAREAIDAATAPKLPARPPESREEAQDQGPHDWDENTGLKTQ